jgi:hypothetical protein
MASLFYYVSVWLCAHTHNTYRGSGPLVLTQSPAQQRPSVGRHQSNCSQRTSLISLLRLSFFGKFIKFQDLGPKNRRLFLLKIVCCFRVKRSAVFCVVSFQSADSMEWNLPVQVKKSFGYHVNCEEKTKEKTKKTRKRDKRFQSVQVTPDYQLNLIEWLIP